MDKKPDMVVTFAFGAPANIIPNQMLAERALNKARKYNISIITQKDISDNFDEITKKGLEIITVPQGEYISTLDIVEFLKKLTETRGWKNVFLVSVKPHQKRCVRDLEKSGFVVVMEKNPIEYYDPMSTHW